MLGKVEAIVEWMGRRGPILSNPSLGTHLQKRRRGGGRNEAEGWNEHDKDGKIIIAEKHDNLRRKITARLISI